MKYTRGVSFVAVVVVLSAMVFSVYSRPAFAANAASLSLSPASGSVQKGKILTINVYENSGGDSVNAVQSNLSYSTALLKYTSFSSSTSLPIEAENPSGNTGSLHFARGTTTSLTGTQLVVTVNFTVVGGSGVAAVDFAGGSAIVRSTDNGEETLATINGNYALSKPVAPKSSTHATHQSTGTQKSTPATATSTPVVTVPTTTRPAQQSSSGLTITDVQAGSDSTNTNTVISWQTSKPSTSKVLYGTDQQHLIPLTEDKLVVSHSVTLPSGVLHPGNTYYYYVSSTDSSGNTVSSQLLPFVAAGNNQSGSNQGIDKHASQVVAAFAFIVIAALLFFGASYVRQRLHEEHELSKHFPDLPTAENQDSFATTIHPDAAAEVKPSGETPTIHKK